MIGRDELHKGFYVFQPIQDSSSLGCYHLCNSISNKVSNVIWHYRLGHLSSRYLDVLKNNDHIHFNNNNSSKSCNICPLAKQSRLPFSSTNPTFHECAKHLKIDLHFVCEKVAIEMIKLSHIRSLHQIADIMTKTLPRPQFQHLIFKMGIINPYLPS